MRVFRGTIAMVSLCLCVLLWPYSTAVASSVIQRPIADIAAASPLVFEGRVVGLAAEPAGKRIFTWVTLEVLDVIKGEYVDSRISLRYLGGVAGGRSLRVSDQTIPRIGEHGVYFLESIDRDSVHPLRGWGQGHFILEAEPSAQGYIVHDSQRRVVRSVSRVDKEALKLNAETAAGVELMQDADALGKGKPLSLQEFKDFIQGSPQ